MGTLGRDSIPSRFYGTRRRVYGGLLLFVVAGGLLVAAVPALRGRLVSRVRALRAAVAEDAGPAMVRLGEEQEPIPAEYERLEPQAAQILRSLPDAVLQAPRPDYAPARAPLRTAPRLTRGKAETAEAETGAAEEPPAEAEPSADSESGPEYRQGAVEKEAYDLLLQSIPAAAQLVQGSEASLQFLSWDAAGRGEDLYWVRLKFRRDGAQDTEYIWQVRLQSRQVTPLNFNARGIS